MYLLFSPLYPLKGKIAASESLTKQVTITPLRGQGGEELRLRTITIA